jgi:dephospho-CoA kinase
MFRDFLRATPEVAAAYAVLKQRVARQFRHDLQHYWIAKGPFIQDAKRRAVAWADQVGWTPAPSDA